MDHEYCRHRKTTQPAETVCIIPDLTIKLGHLASDVLVIQMVAPEHPVHALHTGTMDFVEA